MSPPDLNKNVLDVSQIFQTYIAFGGDVERTAVALDMDRQDILNLAKVENWAAKVEEWTKLREGDPRDVQIQINRAVNYVQAHRLRGVIDSVVSHLAKLSPEQLISKLTESTEKTSKFSARPLADLVKAAEACQQMTARALGDTAGERPESSAGTKGSNIALQVLNAMNAADALGLNSVDVVREQLAPPPAIKPG